MFSHQICFYKGHNFSREKHQDFLRKTVHVLFAVLCLSASLFLTPLALGNSFYRLLQLNPAAEERCTAQTTNKITNEKLL